MPLLLLECLASFDVNRLVAQMRAPLAICREPEGKLWQLCNVLYNISIWYTLHDNCHWKTLWQLHTVWCRYYAVNFLPNPLKIHPIARSLGRGMGCILWVKTVIYIMPRSQQWCVQYHFILDRIITALDCTMHQRHAMATLSAFPAVRDYLTEGQLWKTLMYGSVFVSWCAKNRHILTAPEHLLTAPEDL